MKLEIADVEKAVELPFEKWAGNCHSVSIRIVKSGLIEGPCRVARGGCKGVYCQHSWIILGKCCYREDAKIIDPTMWGYVEGVDGIWYGTMADGLHRPHGIGTIWEWGMPQSEGGPAIELKLPDMAEYFLSMIPGTRDKAFWQDLLSQAPVQGWPVKQVYEAAYEHPELSALIPLDKLGMVTDVNPGGLYLPTEEKA
jgi:hypothetical protein